MQVEVTQKDPQLLNRIFQNELDAFVYKGVTAYLYACGLFCKDDLANTNPYKQDGSYILPKTLRDFNYTIRTSMNPLWKLVESDLATCEEPMTRHKNMCITLTAFTAQYHKYCRTNFKNMHTEDLNSDVYIPVFRKFGIEARVAKRKWEGAWVETTFIDGIGMTRMCVAALRDPSDVRGPLLPLQPPPPPLAFVRLCLPWPHVRRPLWQVQGYHPESCAPVRRRVQRNGPRERVAPHRGRRLRRRRRRRHRADRERGSDHRHVRRRG